MAEEQKEGKKREEKYCLKIQCGRADILPLDRFEEEEDFLKETRGALWCLDDNQGRGYTEEEAEELAASYEDEQ